MFVKGKIPGRSHRTTSFLAGPMVRVSCNLKAGGGSSRSPSLPSRSRRSYSSSTRGRSQPAGWMLSRTTCTLSSLFSWVRSSCCLPGSSEGRARLTGARVWMQHPDLMFFAAINPGAPSWGMSRRSGNELLFVLEQWAVAVGQPSLVLALIAARSAAMKLMGGPAKAQRPPFGTT
jgi:hypothetical protein